jgi:hypothetical protein
MEEGIEKWENSAWLIDDSHISGKWRRRRCRRKTGKHW